MAEAPAVRARFGGGGEVRARPGVVVELGMPEADLEALREIAGTDDLSGAFAKAVALYRTSVQAIREGKHVGITDDADKLETEFVGL
jgi:hypothetical protein